MAEPMEIPGHQAPSTVQHPCMITTPNLWQTKSWRALWTNPWTNTLVFYNRIWWIGPHHRACPPRTVLVRKNWLRPPRALYLPGDSDTAVKASVQNQKQSLMHMAPKVWHPQNKKLTWSAHQSPRDPMRTRLKATKRQHLAYQIKVHLTIPMAL